MIIYEEEVLNLGIILFKKFQVVFTVSSFVGNPVYMISILIFFYIFRAEPERAFLSRGSEWLRTKYAGELAVRDQFPDATIFRCSGIFYI